MPNVVMGDENVRTVAEQVLPPTAKDEVSEQTKHKNLNFAPLSSEDPIEDSDDENRTVRLVKRQRLLTECFEPAVVAKPQSMLLHPLFARAWAGASRATWHSALSWLAAYRPAPVAMAKLDAHQEQLEPSGVAFGIPVGGVDMLEGRRAITIMQLDSMGLMLATASLDGSISIFDLDEYWFHSRHGRRSVGEENVDPGEDDARHPLNAPGGYVQPVRRYETKRAVSCLRWNPKNEGELAVGFSHVPEVLLYDLEREKKRVIGKTGGRAAGCRALYFLSAPASEGAAASKVGYLAIGLSTGAVSVWRLDKTPAQAVEVNAGSPVTALYALGDSNLIAGTASGRLMMWDVWKRSVRCFGSKPVPAVPTVWKNLAGQDSEPRGYTGGVTSIDKCSHQSKSDLLIGFGGGASVLFDTEFGRVIVRCSARPVVCKTILHPTEGVVNILPPKRPVDRVICLLEGGRAMLSVCAAGGVYVAIVEGEQAGQLQQRWWHKRPDPTPPLSFTSLVDGYDFCLPYRVTEAIAGQSVLTLISTNTSVARPLSMYLRPAIGACTSTTSHVLCGGQYLRVSALKEDVTGVWRVTMDKPWAGKTVEQPGKSLPIFARLRPEPVERSSAEIYGFGMSIQAGIPLTNRIENAGERREPVVRTYRQLEWTTVNEAGDMQGVTCVAAHSSMGAGCVLAGRADGSIVALTRAGLPYVPIPAKVNVELAETIQEEAVAAKTDIVVAEAIQEGPVASLMNSA